MLFRNCVREGGVCGKNPRENRDLDEEDGREIRINVKMLHDVKENESMSSYLCNTYTFS